MRFKGLNRIYLIAIVISLSLTSCKKWLNVPDQMQVDQNEIFSNEQGFKDLLNGVYLQIGSKSMFGRDMSYGLLSVLGRSYDTTITSSIGNLYYQGAQYNLQHPEVQAISRSIWNDTYMAVGNINNLLTNMAGHQQLFTGNNYNTINGEALGMRAFLHFELLRLFAPAPLAAGFTTTSIPYMTKFNPYPVSASTTGEVLDLCLADLKAAESLLSEADLNTGHFTIWACRGLLARVYLYKGDMANASLYAKTLINSGKFPLATNNTDLMFSKEHIFSLYTFQNNIINFYKTVFNTSTPLGFTPANQTALFVSGGGSSNDWRKAYVDPATTNAIGNTISPRKFYSTTNTLTPLIRMTEMYYIAAECAAANNDLANATDLMDSVRVHRNLSKYGLTALSSDSLNTEIRKEYQKEFVGEGQMFYYYKRKNIPFASLPFTKVPVVANASYVFTKPE